MQMREKSSKVEDNPSDVGEKCGDRPAVTTACRYRGQYPGNVDEVKDDGQC